MAETDEDNAIAVVAIDFGTTFCGYALSIKGSESEIYVASNWGDTEAIPFSMKTPTCVLTTESNEFIALGYVALSKWEEMVMDGTHPRARLYEKFKLILHTEQCLNLDSVITDNRGDYARALDIFTMVIKELADKAIQRLASIVQMEITQEQVRWVITIPAIWSDSAKQFMKMAALQANLVDDIKSPRLLLSFEPEAASINCLKSSSSEMAIGDKYVIIDAGGGTIDIAAHTVTAENRLGELCVASGGAAGATQIDERFLDLLDEIAEKPFVKEFKKSKGFAALMSHFEIKKRTYNGRKNLQVSLCSNVNDFYYSLHGKNLKESIRHEYHDKGVRIRSGILVLPTDIADGIFAPVIKKILDHIKCTLSKPQLGDVKIIVMVGGFTGCTLLQEAVKKEFREYTIIRPTDAWAAILKGAVFFGQNPHHFKSRILRKTYGIRAYEDFDEDKHLSRKKVMLDGKAYAEVFSEFATKGETVDVDSVKTKTYNASSSHQREVVHEWYSTFNEHPKFVDEGGVEKIGRLCIPLPGEGLNREVEIMMKFGGTEIVIEVKNEKHGRIEKLTLDLFTK